MPVLSPSPLPLSAVCSVSTSQKPLTLEPDTRMDCEWLEEIALQIGPRVVLSERVRREMEASCAVLQRQRDLGTAIYGVTTGFGPFVRFGSAERGGEAHGAGLIAHLGAGWGSFASPVVVRGTMLLRALTLSRGYSGVRPAMVEAYLRLLENEIIPAVPEIGSVGASGDLVPLACIARVLTGEGEILHEGKTRSAAIALSEAGLAPISLDGRDALGLTNGVSFLSAYATLAVARAERLLGIAERLTGWMYRALGCRRAALDPRLHRARGHQGQQRSAAAILREAISDGASEDTTRPLQEIYSLRCAPQVLGACRENLDYARRVIETEINGISDNPLCFPETDDAPEAMLHGGNFHGQQVAFAADALNAALTQAALLVDRQIDALLNPQINGGAPLLLAWEPGATSGMAGAQLTATALAAEMRADAQAHATATIPTNGGNQDIVSMGALAARRAYQQTDRFAAVLAILGIGLQQLDFLRAEGRAPGKTTSAPTFFPDFEPFRQDRPLQHDIARIAQEWLLHTTG